MAEGTAIVISGVARGGTSFVASICANLGIPMGRRGPRFEHPYLQRAVLKNDWVAVAKIAAVTSEHLDVWGWKLPALADQLGEVERVIPKCKFIFVIRNPLGLVPRRTSEDDIRGTVLTINRALRHYIKAGRFFEKTRLPVLFVNFDESRHRAEETIQRIADFCCVPVNNMEAVLAALQSDLGAYKNNTQGAVMAEPLADKAHPLTKAVRKIARKHDLIDAPAALVTREAPAQAG